MPEFLKKSRLSFVLQDLPKKEELRTATATFSRTEKILFWIFATTFILSSAYILWSTNQNFLIERPIRGGELREGVADTPRFINPLLATGEADRDLSALIYSGLLRPAENGGYKNDLAEDYTISADGLSYTFTIKEDASWHDGKPVTSDDIEFTIQKAKDPILRSPKRASFEGVTIEKVSNKKIKFTLKQPFQAFLESTIIGILPKHLWGNIDSDKFVHSELNMRAIGTGPYKIKTISKNIATGIPEYIELIPFKNFVLGEPKISKVIIRFYPNQEKLYEAYKSGEIESMNAVSPKLISEIKSSRSNVASSNLPRVFAIFYNQNQQKILSDKKIREALDVAIDRKRIIDTVLYGHGSIIDGPIPPGFIRDGILEKKEIGTSTPETGIQIAQKLLLKNGWKINPETNVLEKKISKKETQTMEITISSIDFTELKKVAEMIKEDWEKIGIKVNLEIFEKGDFDRNVIEPRKYDALFFGQIVGRNLDLFPFWHSSQRKNPGVNISLYANTKADKMLESIRTENNDDKKTKLLRDLQAEIRNDIPASFIYSPYFLYVTPKEIKNVKVIPPTTASDRFLNIHEWYIKTEKVWKIFE